MKGRADEKGFTRGGRVQKQEAAQIERQHPVNVSFHQRKELQQAIVRREANILQDDGKLDSWMHNGKLLPFYGMFNLS